MAPVLLVSAFFLEAANRSPERPLTSYGIFAWRWERYAISPTGFLRNNFKDRWEGSRPIPELECITMKFAE